MTYDDLMDALSDCNRVYAEDLGAAQAVEAATDAMSFVKGLHDVFKENGMTSSDEPDLAEMENLFDAIHGELGALCLFLCAPSFERVPDMLRAIGKQLEKSEGSEDVPLVVRKGFERVAARIEKTRQAQQQLIQTTTDASDKK